MCSKSTPPNEWRNAIVIPVCKKGDKRNPKNYRGISVSSTCYKIYSKFLIRNYKNIQKYKMDSEEDVRAPTLYFALNY
jgi:hypothetical protein